MGADSSLAGLWAELHATRRGWAWRGYESFRAGLSREIQDHLLEGDRESSIVLYGPTQVGKTTLLLHLLGIDEKYMDHVATLLRGGRAIGNSATATATRYERTSGDRWRLCGAGGDHELDERDLLTRLAYLRGQVEGDSAEIEANPIRIGIPARFFDPAREMQLRTRILDLPGINAENANEAAYVRRVANRFVPFADLVLILTTADNLKLFAPGELAKQGLRACDWSTMPARFRLVTSYSFSLQTMADLVTASDEDPVTLARRRLADQIGSFGPSADPGQLLFPLEFGASWAKVKETQSELWMRVNPSINQAIKDLEAQIMRAADPINRLNQAADAHLLAAARLHRQRAARRRRATAICKVIGKWRRLARLVERRLAAHRDGLREIPDDQPSQIASLPMKQRVDRALARLEIIFPENINVAVVQDAISGFRRKIFACINQMEICQTSEEDFQTWLIFSRKIRSEQVKADIEALIDDAFHEIVDRLNGYWIDIYFFESTEKRDRLVLAESGQKAGLAVSKKIATLCEDACEARRTFWTTRRRKAMARIENDERILSRIVGRIAENRRRLAAHIEASRIALADMEADFARARYFETKMRAALHEELAVRRSEMAIEPVPARRLLKLFGALAVCDQAAKLLGSSDQGARIRRERLLQ